MSYSQYGEDLIIAGLYPEGFTGRLLEIGAYDPLVMSNSRLLIERGWEALLIDASPWAISALIEKYRPQFSEMTFKESNVQIVQAAVTLERSAAVPLFLTKDGVSSGNPAIIEKWQETGGYIGWCYCASITLPQISLQFGQFDFVSIDTEGTSVDLAIQWLAMKQRPRVLMVEHDERMVELMAAAQVCGYRAVHLNGTNVVLAL